MESISSSIVAALLAAITAGVKDVSTAAIRDAYASLKAVIVDRYKRITSLEAVESDPASKPSQEALEEALRTSGADTDEEILAHAEALIHALGKLGPDKFTVIGVDIDQLNAGSVRIKNVRSIGTAVRVKRTTVGNALHIESVEAGLADPNAKKL